MSKGRFKIFRILVSAAMFLTFAAAFCGFFPQTGQITKEGFFPAFWSVLSGRAGHIAVAAFCFWAFALIAGRVFCSFGCPLGFLQDIAGKLGHLRKRPYRPLLPRRIFRYGFAAFCWGLLLGGGAALFGWIEPYSLCGRFFNSLFRPLVQWFGNTTDWWAFSLITPAAWSLLCFTGLFLLLLLGSAAWGGRIFCNYCCPVGAFLGILSRRARFRLRFTEKCIGCGQCVKVCKAGCIDLKNKAVDSERCVVCGNCQAACRFGGLTRKPENPKCSAEELQPALSDPQRRKLLMTAIPALAAGFLAGKKLPELAAPATLPPAPPGAGRIRDFLQRCTGCQLCVANCSGHTLAVATTEYGPGHAGQVYLSTKNGFCDFNCRKCSQLCPAGALMPMPLAQKKRWRVGMVSYKRSLCVVVTDGTDCGACAEHCPTGALTMVPWKNGLTIPAVTASLCIGCGACQYICPVRPVTAVTVSGVELQTIAADPKKTALPKQQESKASTPAGGAFPF